MGKSFEQQMSEYFKEDYVKTPEDKYEKELKRLQAIANTKKREKFNSSFKKDRKKKLKMTKASRKKNR